MVNTTNPALDERPESLDGLGMNVAQYIHASRVINTVMGVVVPVVSKVNVGRKVVRKYRGFWKHVLPDDRHQRVFLPVVRNHCLDSSATLNHAKDGCFVPHGLILALRDSADSSLIHLDAKSLQLHIWFGQQRANLAKHPPCRFIGNASLALNLLRGYSATRDRKS